LCAQQNVAFVRAFIKTLHCFLPILKAEEQRMLRFLTRRASVAAAALAFFAVCASAAGAQTVLLVVKETLNTSPVAPPFAVHEGLAAALFDDGAILIDLPGGADMAKQELLRTAVAGGADFVLSVAVDYAGTGSDAPTVQGHATWSLQTVTGTPITSGTLDATNRGRERSVGRTALGAEIGAALAARAWAAMGRASS
jgi:hypothetical protein